MDTATSASTSPMIPCAEKNRHRSLLGGTSEGREAMYRQSVEDSPRFWSQVARKEFVWKTYWPEDQNVCSYNFDKTKGPVFVKWFEGGLTNVCYNAVDRHAEKDKNRVCFYWEGNDPKKKETITYGEMQERVIRCANVLRSQYGIQKGDVVAMYLPMIPFTTVCMMACARIGAIPLVVFAGFSSEALAARLQAGHPKLLITADASFRGNKRVPLHTIVHEALGYLSKECPPGGSTTPTTSSSSRKEAIGVPTVRSTSSKVPLPTPSVSLPCLVFPNEGRQACPLRPGRDVWYDEAEQRLTAEERRHCPIEWVDAEHVLFILYTSGSTGRPKAVVHTTGGYMVYSAATFRYVFDYHPDDVYFCTGDIGWITGHSYGLYGPMLNGATSILFEGTFNYPTLSRWWELVETYKVTLFYTAPTALRLLRKFGDAPLRQHDLSSLRVLGSVGEPMNTETWQWYYEVVGRKKVDIVDTYWQTETGGHMLTGLPGCTPMKPGCTGLPFLGVRPVLLDHKTFTELKGKNASGLLAMAQPWPGICRTLLGEHDKYEQLYFSHNGYFLTGDGARRDEDAYYWITGRVDDVLNVSGHRLGTSEIEDAVTSHPSVVECAVVGVPHDIKGESVYVYFTPRPQVTVTMALMEEIKQTVRHRIGPLASPDGMHPAPDGLPKTRSGKIVRRMLRKIAMKKDDDLGDVSTLMDPKVVPALIEARKKWVEKKVVAQKGKL